MAEVQLISEQFLKDSTTINLNVEPTLLINGILDAQMMHIMPILGSSLYLELINQVENSTLTALNQTLLNNYIQKAVAKWALVEVLPDLLIKIMNKSVVKKNSDNSESITKAELDFEVERAMNKAQFYTERLRKYLLQNQVNYPLYMNPGAGCDVVIPRQNTYFSGMYLSDCLKRVNTYSEREHFNEDY